mmetsp:Transcript_7545/g.17107  ORF Transcript_7545/g.17107 Transcript_7545/m.17107 type:complete len:218 (-) Transcript_7545:1168-1821(-)
MSDSESTSDSESMSDASSVDADSMTNAELREYHQRKCEEGDGWSHGFVVSYEEEDQADNEENTSYIFEVRPKSKITQRFMQENWQRMGEDISKSPILKRLDLSSCDLTEDGIVVLFGEGLTYINSPLKYLILGGNSLGTSGIAALIPFLKSAPSVSVLDLSRICLGDEGARLLSEALKHTHIEDLTLVRNSIGDEGVEHILSAIASQSNCLTSLDNF